MAEDYYKVLGVSRGASTAEIQKAYRGLARKYHPDLFADRSEKEKAEATRKFQQVQQAYDVLSDDDKRQMYDQLGPDFEKMGGRNPFGGAGGGGQPFDFSQIFGGPGGGGPGMGMEDLFRQFGMPPGAGGPGGHPGRHPQAAPPGPQNGADVAQKITVPFSAAVLGGNHQVSIQRTDRVENITVKIPAGIESGGKLRLRGQGHRGFDGGQRGDLKITVIVAPHPVYTRSGLNLKVKVPLTLKEAVDGGKIDLPTPHGTISLTIPPGSSGGKSLRLKGMGIKSDNGSGDLIATLQIALPEPLSDEDRQRIDRLEEAWDGADPREELIW